jgi:hypothetical protein
VDRLEYCDVSTALISFYTDFTIGRGRVLGATLTISSRDGAVLIAFLALFVTWTGNELWSVIRYALHQRWSTGVPQNAFRRQVLVMLRNSLSPWQFSWKLIRLTWAWSKATRGPTRRQSIPLVSLTLILGTCFAIAGLFSSRVASTTGNSLIASNVCGFPDFTVLSYNTGSVEELQRASAIYVAGALLFDDARTQSRNCFDPYTPTKIFGCPAFIHKQKFTSGAECPFTQESCQSSVVSLDSGLLDSHDDLGINSPPSGRIQFRRTLNCSVIPLEEKYSSDWVEAESLPLFYSFPVDPSIARSGVQYKFYNIGPSISGQNQRNFTFVVANFSSPAKSYNTL